MSLPNDSTVLCVPGAGSGAGAGSCVDVLALGDATDRRLNESGKSSSIPAADCAASMASRMAARSRVRPAACQRRRRGSSTVSRLAGLCNRRPSVTDHTKFFKSFLDSRMVPSCQFLENQPTFVCVRFVVRNNSSEPLFGRHTHTPSRHRLVWASKIAKMPLLTSMDCKMPPATVTFVTGFIAFAFSMERWCRSARMVRMCCTLRAWPTR